MRPLLGMATAVYPWTRRTWSGATKRQFHSYNIVLNYQVRQCRLSSWILVSYSRGSFLDLVSTIPYIRMGTYPPFGTPLNTQHFHRFTLYILLVRYLDCERGKILSSLRSWSVTLVEVPVYAEAEFQI